MGQKGKFNLIKVNYKHLWKNNFILFNQKKYSNFFFKLTLIKNYINFFFLYSISRSFIRSKISFQRLYLSQIWAHSYKDFIILSLNIKYTNRYIYKKNLLDNYIRLKYSSIDSHFLPFSF